jgi:hypothetical protein
MGSEFGFQIIKMVNVTRLSGFNELKLDLMLEGVCQFQMEQMEGLFQFLIQGAEEKLTYRSLVVDLVAWMS